MNLTSSQLSCIDDLLLAYRLTGNLRTAKEIRDLILEFHAADPELNIALPFFNACFDFTSELENFLLEIISNNSHSAVVGPAKYHLANGYWLASEGVEFLNRYDLSLVEFLNLAYPDVVSTNQPIN